MATHTANKFQDKASTDDHNGGHHVSRDRASKEGVSTEKENIKPYTSNGTTTMVKGTKPTNNHQRYLVTAKQNSLTSKDGSPRSEGEKDVSSKPKPKPSPRRNKPGSKKIHPKDAINNKSPKKKKKKRKFRLGLGVRQRVDYGKLDKFNSRVGLTTGILQLVLALEAVTLGALQYYFRPDYGNLTNALYVWPSVVLCIMCGIFGTWSSRGKGTYVVFLYMLVSIFACITSCMMFGLEVHSTRVLRQMCSGTPSPTTKSPSAHVTVENTSTQDVEDCSNNYGLNMAISVILAIIALCQILISFVAAIGSSNVMCSKENHEILVEECLSDDDDGEPPPPNAGLPQIKRHDRAMNRRS